ncbi:unnamed protein product [Linum trigynum]|uniref:Uncharacterized protein n=1 Tax=Linum trigynum TaxID=586398 RepID=A0AAV2ED77_9ROSI
MEAIPAPFSDHCGILVSTVAPIKSLPKPFKYFEFWAEHPLFLGIVEEAWNGEVSGSPLQVIQVKMGRVKQALKKINKEVYGNLQDQVKEAEGELLRAQTTAYQDPTSDNFEAVSLKKDHYNHIISAYESFCWQKSRVSWLKVGDQSSNFFHQAVKIHNSKRAIRKLVTDSGVELYQAEQLVEEVLGYYKKLLGEVNMEINPSREEVDQLVRQRLPDHECANLVKEITAEEIRSVVFSLNPQKAPGPDGFSA